MRFMGRCYFLFHCILWGCCGNCISGRFMKGQRGATWGYTRSNGETQWFKNFPYCGGPVQSPVDFKTEKLVFDPTLLPIGVHNYALPTNEELVLGNNGHTLFLSLPSTMYISNLPQRYSAAQLHLHWGSVTKPLGSEHTVNSKQYAAELHIVHFNSEKYTDVAMAFDKSDGLAVLGIFIQIGEFNPAYDKFIKHLSQISNKGTKTKIPAFNIRKLMPTRLDEYYRYDGSLTAPPCYASVLWTVFKNHVTISKEQYKTLTTTLFASGAKQNTPVPLIGNFRNLLPAENRVVLTSFKAGVTKIQSAACPFERKNIVKQLLHGDFDEVIEHGLFTPSAAKLLLQQQVNTPKTLKDQVVARTSKLKKMQEIANPILAFGTLRQLKSLEAKQSTTPVSLPAALGEAILPKLNLRSYLTCKASLAPATIKYLVSGGPLEIDTEDSFLLDPYISGSSILYPWLFSMED
ncbi:carbonic anhydrase 12-like isoform X1 [Nerophis ophidion]|uniref:carbonic anhydrase 12-like isoform X1 n=1 Tax=Nerophis ophidion TaxID=159077 RepID=UPI002ADFD660|nr:carbonic anhydrase 12-like isoform X1 [Nerophis ophidion]